MRAYSAPSSALLTRRVKAPWMTRGCLWQGSVDVDEAFLEMKSAPSEGGDERIEACSACAYASVPGCADHPD